ncbi:NAD(P)H-binding protein [Paenibacillus sinopodophylli]|uniref:NAD(P)H-binding protein n=1 Tax=Paenibacillus sinopodophylli TaxID=1837342 RepID=UPI00110CF6C9|nr:NAD(P)H-binding protein [Paenibacillus sinopodophylli]
MRVLVTGATGSVGRHIVEQLLEIGIEVRALSRTAGSLPTGVDVVLGDLDYPEGLASYLQDVDRIFLITQSDQSDAKFAKNESIIQMAKQANVKRIVALIDFYNNPIEEVIQNSGMEWTILKPVEFMKNALYGWAESIQKEGKVRHAFPNSLSAQIHERDIAAVAVRALTEEGHHHKIYHLTGPESLTIRSMVKQISEIIDKPIAIIELTEEQVRQEWKEQGFDDTFINYFIIEMGKNPPAEVFTVRSTVEDVTGKPATTFVQWVNENKSYFI